MNKGFTLIELMIVIVIIGILASIAIPKFSMASYKAKTSEFPTILQQIYNMELIAQAETGEYKPVDSLGIGIPSSKIFDYYVVKGVNTFQAVARVKTGFGDAMTTDTAAINQDGVRSATPTLRSYCPSWGN